MAPPLKKGPNDGMGLAIRLLKGVGWLVQHTDGLTHLPDLTVPNIVGMLSLANVLYHCGHKLYSYLKKRQGQETESEPQDSE
jgi:hypothetical protein